MILTCPACQTRYLVDPASLGPRGRAVRCAKCAHTWTQEPPPDAPKSVEPPPPPPPPPATPPPTAMPTATPRPMPRRTNLPALPRQRRRGSGLAVILLILILGGLGAVAYLKRDRFEGLRPRIESLLASVGIGGADALEGLRIVDAKIERLEEGGATVIVVSGAIVNDTQRVVAAPNLRGVFRDAAKNEIASWTFAPSGERLLPSQSMPFLDRYVDPPEGAVDLAVVFDGGT